MTLFRPKTHKGWKENKYLQHSGDVVEVSEERDNREGPATKLIGWLLEKQLKGAIVWLFFSLLKSLVVWFFKFLYREAHALVDSFFDWIDRKVCERAQAIKERNEQR
jgi:hypothetical protein